MSETKYYIDFDDTLFNTAAFKRELYKILEDNGLDKTYIVDTLNKQDSSPKLFNIRKMFKGLSETKRIPLENFIKPLEELYNRCVEFVHNDSVEFLKFLKDNGNKVCLLTYGDAGTQEEKVKASKLDGYFDEIIYAEVQKYTLDNVDYKNGIFVDDNLNNLEALKNQNAIEVIRIKRIGAKNSKKELPDTLMGILEVETLKELQKIIQENIRK